MRSRASAAIRKLMDLRPATARVIREGHEVEIPAESVMVNEIIVVRPGEKIPTDGIVTEGGSSVDEKLVTGESMPVAKKPGDKVISATLNKMGALKYKATQVGADTTLMQIVKMVEEAQASVANARIQRIADKVSAVFVPVVVSIALAAFFGRFLIGGNLTSGVLAFVAVLIISCPCAIGIATPTALFVGVGKGAQTGILIRGGEYLESAQKLTTVVLDKTGNPHRILERRREIATMRTLGESKGGITKMITIENLILGFVGIIVGIPLGYMISLYCFSLLQTDMLSYSLVVFPRTYLMVIAVIILAMMISQIPAIRHVNRMNLASAINEHIT